jgi:hypothetical protein
LAIGVRNGFKTNRGVGLKEKWAIAALCVLCMHAARADTPDSAACGIAGRAAEQAGGLPANMLVSIGMVESGRADPLSGHVAPWPWTVNADGAGRYFENKADAEAFVRLAESSGAHDVDVGCFQISLQSHPDAFASLDAAFDPVANANYAAVFLNQLKSQTGSWNTAIADYHSALPDLGLPYQRLVLAAWHGLGNAPVGFEGAVFEVPDPVVVMQSALARSVHVYTMDDPPSAGLRAGLPRVITP